MVELVETHGDVQTNFSKVLVCARLKGEFTSPHTSYYY